MSCGKCYDFAMKIAGETGILFRNSASGAGGLCRCGFMAGKIIRKKREIEMAVGINKLHLFSPPAFPVSVPVNVIPPLYRP